uniref:phosphatase PAP2 family protein n=1 Tax=Ningiella ruwaisensis TaxID=2364274 RepID=UPI00109F747F|nr:phosphatase PAP2 family protein [Ningiella ruwaisensis]
MRRLAYLDQQVFQWITKHLCCPDQFSVKVFKWISRSGDGYLYILVATLLYFYDPEHGALFFYTALLAYSIEIPLYVVLKHLFKRKRPCDLLYNLKSHIVPADKFSLPSGHTAAAFLMATIVAQYYPTLTLFVFVWASLIGISRIVLRVHFPLDVIIGASLGLCMAISAMVILG